jgi:predicted RNA polymerase sigma factor
VPGSVTGKGVEAAVAGAFREEWGRLVATLIRTTGDWDLAEECAQEEGRPLGPEEGQG